MKPIRALGYARVSSVQQALGTSLQDQQASIRRYAESIGVPIARMYVEAESGIRQKNEQREQMLALKADVRAGDIVLCDKLDRWSRDTEWTLRSVREIQEAGATFFAVSDNCDPSTREGDMMLTMRAMMAKEEHARIKDRLVGTRNLLRLGGQYTDPVAPTGYRIENRTLIVVPEIAERVREVFRLCARGFSLTRLSETTGFERSVVNRMLKCRYYIGETRLVAKRWTKGKHEAIVTPALWAAAHEALLERRRGGARPRDGETSTWVLRNLAMCGACGARMSAAYAGPKDSPKRRHYYRCSRKCGATYVAVRTVEGDATAHIVARLLELKEELSRGPAPPKSGASAITAAEQQAKLARQRERILDLYVNERISREGLQDRLAAIDAKIAALSVVAPSGISEPARRSALRTLGVMEKSWARASHAAKREIVENLAKRVMITAGAPPEFVWRSIEEMAE